VVHRRQRQLPGGRQGLGGRQAHQQRPDKPRALRCGKQLDLGQRDPRPVQCLLHDQVDKLEVVTRGDLGNDPTEAVVNALR
jgi:hypothetical protein